jgi:hypothetical protein
MSEKKSARKASATSRKDDIDDLDLPLLDEVNKVIEKEKTLLALKLLDQEQQALEWQQKYNDLIDKVADNGGKAAATMEFIADSMTTVVDHSIAPEHMLVHPSAVDRDFILKRLSVDQTSLNLSNIDLNQREVLQTIAKFLSTWKKDKLAKGISLISMSHCNLNDENIELLDILANPNIQGLDLSHNHLSIAFQRNLFQVYKVCQNSMLIILG